MSPVIDLDTKTLAVAGVVVLAGIVAASLFVVDVGGPEIRQGTFVADSTGLLAVGAQTCSADSDCEPTTCAGDDSMVDTDGDVACTDHDGDGDRECTGYDETYGDADYCGGRYDYNCDSAGCDGFKAACEDSCSANAGCDTYSFCQSDDDDDGSSDDSSSDSGTSEPSCTDQCTSLTKACSGGDVYQCQDTDSDPCTDGYVRVAACDNGCSNAACITEPVDPSQPDDDDQSSSPTEDDDPVREEITPGQDTNTAQTLVERIHEVWQRVVVALLGGV